MAVKALAMGLRNDSAPPARLLYIEALAKIDTPEAAKALAIAVDLRSGGRGASDVPGPLARRRAAGGGGLFRRQAEGQEKTTR